MAADVRTAVYVVRGAWEGYTKTRRYFTNNAAAWRAKWWRDGCCGGRCDCDNECVELTPVERAVLDAHRHCSICREGPAQAVSITTGVITWNDEPDYFERVPTAVPPSREPEEVAEWLSR